MNFSTYGRALFMVGGNADASFLAALPVKRYRFIAYTLSGFSAGLAGVILTARLYAAAPQAATGLEFSVIAAVVLGGTSLVGGKGTLLGTAIGVLILGTLNNGMTLLSLSSDYQQIVQGLVLALAVAIDQFRLGAVPITILGMTQTADGRLKLLAAEGESIPGSRLEIGNTNSRLRFGLDPATFMDHWCEHGPTHHVALGVGHQLGKIRKLARLLDLELAIVG